MKTEEEIKELVCKHSALAKNAAYLYLCAGTDGYDNNAHLIDFHRHHAMVKAFGLVME
jgi:hypothetical protein